MPMMTTATTHAGRYDGYPHSLNDRPQFQTADDYQLVYSHYVLRVTAAPLGSHVVGRYYTRPDIMGPRHTTFTADLVEARRYRHESDAHWRRLSASAATTCS